MARPVFWATDDSYVFSVSASGYVLDSSAMPVAGSQVKIYTAQTGGTQVTDLQYVDAAGAPTGAVPSGVLTSDGDGLIPSFAGPDNGPTTLWGNHGHGGVRLALTSGPVPGGGGAVSTVDGQTGAVDLSGTYALLDAGDIRRYGAVTNTDCTAAFDDARAASNNIYVPAGNWTYNGAGLNWQGLTLRGAGRSQSHVILGAGVALIVGTGAGSRFTLADLSIEQGFGAIRLTGTGSSVAATGMLTVERVDFYLYTGAAFSHRFSDCPTWTFRECAFLAANETTAFGIVLPGDSAMARIDHCLFGRNKAHIKLGPAGGSTLDNLAIANCDMLRNNELSAATRIDVWIVPGTVTANPGAPHLKECAFGAENRGANDIGILIANQDGNVADPAISQPDMTTASTNGVSGLLLEGCIFGSFQPSPLIYSMTPKLLKTTIQDLKVIGGGISYLVQFADTTGVAAAIGTAQGSINGLRSQDSGRTSVTVLSNAAHQPMRVVGDPLGTIDTGSGNLLQNPGGQDRLGYVSTITTSPASNVTVGANNTKNAVVDGTGGADAVEIATTTTLYVYGSMTGLIVGELHWVEFDLAPASSGTTAGVITLNTWNGTTADFQQVINVPTSWRRFRFAYLVRDATASQLRFTATTANGGVKIGRIRTYHAPEPIGTLSGLTVGTQVDVFTTAGTWSKPLNAVACHVLGMGPGGPSGSGCRGAAGTVRSGGGSGGGGGRTEQWFRASDLTSTVAVQVGSGGTGGAAVTTDDTNGNPGSGGTYTYFAGGTYLRAGPGGPGGGGSTAAGAAGTPGVGGISGVAGSASSATGGVGAGGLTGTSAGCGGGAGGGITSGDVEGAGGAGASVGAHANTGANATAGAVPGGAGGDGTDVTIPGLAGNSGAGGAASQTTAAGKGGKGGKYGSGAGGGGASLNGFDSGPGDSGGAGILIVTTHF